MEESSRKSDATPSEIREILRERRETLDRVRADLNRVESMQQAFEAEKTKSEKSFPKPRVSL